jgi:uncharacterized protein (DUF1800 family)
MNPTKTLTLTIFIWLTVLTPAFAGTPTNPKILHLLNRLGYGPRPGDVQKVESIGVEKYIQQQLHPDSIPEPSSLTDRLAQLQSVNLTLPELLAQVGRQRSQLGQKPSAEQRQESQQKIRMLLQEAVQTRILRAVESPRQLQEVMVDFWYNHFNVFAGKGIDRLLVDSYEQQAIRPHVLGRFRDLLEATARHPAMLFYLDNWQNTAPNSPGARGRFKGLNENYARELMELHTLGVSGGYTQQDVITLAKILTGWGFRRGGQANSDNGFYFDPKRHDFSDKVFLGHPIKGSGEAEVEQALDILAKHPATARHISYQLAQYFVADQPPKALVDRLAQKFLATNGDIRAMLNTLFHSPEFWDSKTYQAKFKTPYEFVISAFRATGTPATNPRQIQGILQQLGMPIYGCPTPDGYKNTEDAWLNPDGMTRRLSFATTLASGRFPLVAPAENNIALAGVSPEPNGTGKNSSILPINGIPQEPRSPLPLPTQATPVDAAHLMNTLGNRFSAKTEQAIAASPASLRAALILGSPEFMRR